MGNARAVRTSTSTSTTTAPAPTNEPAKRASFADGMDANSPQSAYADANPSTTPAQLSKSKGDLTIKGAKKKEDSLGNVEAKTSGATTVNAKEKKASVSAGHSAGGTSGSGGASVDLRDDGSIESLGANGSYTKGGTGGGGGGSVNVDEQGRVQGLAANGKAQSKGGSISGSLSMGRKTSAPREVDGVWEVDWDYDASVGAAGGATKAAFGGSAGGSASANRGGTQCFGSEAEAVAFRAAFSEADDAFIASLTKVNELGDGESMGSSSEMSGSISLSAKAGQFTGGAGVKATSGSGWTVKRQGEYYMLVVKRDSSLKTTFSGSVMGMLKLSMGDTNRRADAFGVRFRANDRKHNAALSTWLSQGVVSGGDLMWMETGKEHDDSAGLGVLGMRFEFVGTTGKKVVRYADGSTVETQVGQSNTGVSVPLLGKHDESNRLTAETDADGTTYALSTRVKSDSATAAQQAMAQATGGTTWGAWGDAESSGQWSVTSDFSEKQIAEFVAWVTGGAARDRLAMVGSAWLVDRMAGAKGNPDALRGALAEFVADAGGKGLAVIHEVISGDVASFPELSGDKTFLGKDGWSTLEARADEWESSADDASLAGQIAAEAAGIAVECDARVGILGDRTNYQDLSSNLRSQEMDRNYSMKFRMLKLAKDAKAVAREAIVSKIDDRAQVSGDGVIYRGEKKGAAKEATANVDTELGMLRAEVEDLYAGMEADKTAALSAKREYDRSVHEHTHHQGGRQVAPKDYFGHVSGASSWGVTWFDGSYVAQYKAAESDGTFATSELAKAQASLAVVARDEADYLDALANPSSAMPTIKNTMTNLRKTSALFQSAGSSFSRADRTYRSIAKDTRGEFRWPSYYP